MSLRKKTFLSQRRKKSWPSPILSKAPPWRSFCIFAFWEKNAFPWRGWDALIPMLEFLLEKGVGLGMKNIALGMSHRGRINVLINILQQNPQLIFSEFEPSFNRQAESAWTQDVQHHLGFSSRRETKNGPCSLYLGYNPSHLEAIGPVICGVSRAIPKAKQRHTEKKIHPAHSHSRRCRLLRAGIG